MKKHISSQDPRKGKIVAALKTKSGGSKVTLVAQIGGDLFRGHCQKRGATKYDWISLGFFEVTGKEAGLNG